MPPKSNAPAAQAQGKSAPKSEQKPKKEKAEPKRPAPNREKHNEEVKEIDQVIARLQKEEQDLKENIGERFHGKDDHDRQKYELIGKLKGFTASINALNEQKTTVIENDKKDREKQRTLRTEANRMKQQMQYTSEDEIDKRISEIDFILISETMSLKEEKKLLQEISELKKSKPKVEQMRQTIGQYEKESNMPRGEDVEQMKNRITSDLKDLLEQKKAVQDELQKLEGEWDSKASGLKSMYEEKKRIRDEITKYITEKKEKISDFYKEKDEYDQYMDALKRDKMERLAKEKAKRKEEWEYERRKREVEQMDDMPFFAEVTLLQQTIKFCKSLQPKNTDNVQQEKKEVQLSGLDGCELLVKKENRDEYFFAPKSKAKATKHGGKQKVASKAIKHNVETFKLFEKLKLDAPMTIDDIPECLKQLESSLEDYNIKIKEFEAFNAERKRQIMEEGKSFKYGDQQDDDVQGDDVQGDTVQGDKGEAEAIEFAGKELDGDE